jgi:hypothetical protein
VVLGQAIGERRAKKHPVAEIGGEAPREGLRDRAVGL